MRTRLKNLRAARGLSLRELSRLTGVGVSTIGNFENGRTEVSPVILKKLASVLRCSEDELLETDEQMVETAVQAQLRGGVDPVIAKSTTRDLEEMLSTFVQNLRANSHPALKAVALDNIEKFTRAIRQKLNDEHSP